LCPGPKGTVYVCDSEAVAIHQFVERTGNWQRTLRLTEDFHRPVALDFLESTAELLVVDVASHDIKVLDPDGRLLRVIGRRGSAPGEFNYPCDITHDKSLVWVADSCNQRVQGLTYDGEARLVFGEPGDAPGKMALPKGVAVDSDGNIYVVDARFENIQIFSREGDLLLVIGNEGRGPGELSLPSGISIDSTNRIWICDTYNKRIQVLEPVKTTDAGDRP
jgi:sugar lactone lactonase YvrE